MEGLNDSDLPFDQAYYPESSLTIGFESEQLTYTDYAVDLFNSGINQILSVAAVRGHRLLHFSMEDLSDRDGEWVAEATVLGLDSSWDRADPLHAHRHLKVVDRLVIPLADVQSVEATLSTTDKYGPIERPRLRVVRRAVQAAFRSAAEAAERIYH